MTTDTAVRQGPSIPTRAYYGLESKTSTLARLREHKRLAQIVQGVWLNVGVPANGPIPPTSWAYDSSIPYIKRDLAKVKAKLAVLN